MSSYSGEAYGLYYNMWASWRRGAPALAVGGGSVWILGEEKQGAEAKKWIDERWRGLSYFTYRNRLPIALPNGSDHDAGWGCMIRTGQMMLSESLRRLYSICLLVPDVDARHWASLRTHIPDTVLERLKSIEANFRDDDVAPFGLHAFVQAGVKHAATPAGSWFSPTALARTIPRLVAGVPDLSVQFEVISCHDGVVPWRTVVATLREKRRVLLLIPVMTGVNRIEPSYTGPILRCLELPWSVGIVGGRPRESLYFAGHQDEAIFFLDPHVVQPALVSQRSTSATFGGPRGVMEVTSLDPSMLLCFLLHTDDDATRWRTAFEPIHRLSTFPMFSVVDKEARGTASMDDVVDF